MKRHVSPAAFLGVLMLANVLHADPKRCDDKDTITVCWPKLVTTAEEAKKAKENVAKKEGASNTGADAGRDFSAVLTNFGKLLSAEYDFVRLADDKSSLSVEYAFVPGSSRVFARAVLTRPLVNAEIVKKLGENAAALDEAKSQLGDFDDVSVALTVDIGGAQTASSLIFERLQGAQGLLLDFPDFIQKCALEARAAGNTVEKDADVTIGQCPAIYAKTAASKETATSIEDDFKAISEDLPLAWSARRQFIVELTGNLRDSLVGRDEVKAVLKWEEPFENPLVLPTCTSNDSVCWDATKKAIRASSEWAKESARPRFSLSAEGRYQACYDVALNQGAVKFSKGRFFSIGGKAAFGVGILAGKQDADEVGNLRLDIGLSGSYQRERDSTTREDKSSARFVGNVTLSFKATPALTIPLGIVVANKPEFLGEPDRKVSAHLGINFKLPKV